MNIILLSGGSGKRLWPISNDIRAKQFVKIFKNENGIYESMVQRMYRQIKSVDCDATITIATSADQVPLLNEQLGENVGISVEPCRRDTFPAIALATAYLYDAKNVSLDDIAVVCPVDPYVNEDYFCAIKELGELAKENICNLSLLGISPTYPSEKFGYIIPETNETVSRVELFKEKPNIETAKKYIEQGAMWNAGIFAFKIKYVLDIAEKLFGTAKYSELYDKYESLNKISFDYAVVEREEKIQVMRFNGKWDDLGTWNALTEVIKDETIGSGIITHSCENVHIINELNIPILCMGLKDVVVSATLDGILISDKKLSSEIKPFVDQIGQQSCFVEQSWGGYRVLDASKNSKTIKLIINPNQKTDYHSHSYRSEVWSVVEGSGYAIIDGLKHALNKGDVISIEKNCMHAVVAEATTIEIIETQIGEVLIGEDVLQ